MTVLAVLAVLAFFGATDCLAAVYGGMAFDTSSNMLQRPDGESGTMSSLYGGFSASPAGFALAYDGSAGVLSGYDGIQFHDHVVTAARVMPVGDGVIEAALGGRSTRYGDVTVLDGFDQASLDLRARRYLTRSLLARGSLSLRRRSYGGYGSETFNEVAGYLRIDRFFDAGVTLRGQFDAGVKRWTALPGSPVTTLVGARIRVARSFGPRWGGWCELFARDIDAEAPSDAAVLTDRVFLDDDYKNDAVGLKAGSKRLFAVVSAELVVALEHRTYDRVATASFDYLPAGGWDEDQAVVSLVIARNAAARLRPSLELYGFVVDASESDYSYSGAGAALSVEVW